jgi:hypothetical protein
MRAACLQRFLELGIAKPREAIGNDGQEPV